MSDALRLAIADPNDESREALKAVLLSMEDLWLDAECSRYEFFADVVGQSVPDAAIINLDTDPDKSVELVQTIHADTPSVGVIVVSSSSDGQLILRAIRAGAKEFVAAPVQASELMAALERIGQQTGTSSTPTRKKGHVVAVCGTTGGVGSTSIAVNLAAMIAESKQNSVVLMDLDLALGDTDVFLDIIPEHTLLDVTDKVEGLDLALLKKSLTQHESGIHLLPRPVHLQDIHSVTPEALGRIIGLIKTSYTHLIIDVSKSYNELDFESLAVADVILLVTQLDLPCLRNTVRLLASMESTDGLRDKVKVIVNRVGLNNGQISLKKAQESIRDEIFWQIPNDYTTMVEVRNNGVPLQVQAPKAAITTAFRSLNRALFETGSAEDDDDKNKKSRGLLGMFKGKAKS